MALPEWLSRADEALASAARQIWVLSAATPHNLTDELERLHAAWANGRPEAPHFQYVRRNTDWAAWERALLRMADGLPDEPVGALYAARARELAAEAAICEAVDTPRLRRLAAERYRAGGPERAQADELSRSWLEAAAEHEPPAEILADDERDPQSLVVRMRAALAERGVPFRVEVTPRLAALAATGDGVVMVAAARRVSRADVERTVAHEVEGHVLPRREAARATLRILRLGTAGGSDDQEGRALCIEERRGLLGGRRRRELALRHRACVTVEAQADFVETTRLLVEHGTSLVDALRIAARAHRGGGLAREIVYLPAYCRVKTAQELDPEADEVLSSGHVSVEWLGAVRRLMAGAPRAA